MRPSFRISTIFISGIQNFDLVWLTLLTYRTVPRFYKSKDSFTSEILLQIPINATIIECFNVLGSLNCINQAMLLKSFCACILFAISKKSKALIKPGQIKD